MYNISQVSINEAFSPLLGVDVTLQNNLTARLEYRQTRVLSLSMTSVQLNEASSKDWVIGIGYRINDFNLSTMVHDVWLRVRRKRHQTPHSKTTVLLVRTTD